MPPNHLPTADDVARRIDEMLQEMARYRTPEFLDIGITMAQAKVLHLVGTTGELHMSALVHALGVSVSTVSELVDRLVEHGFLARRDDPADRRHVVVSLTPAGTALLDRFRDLNGAVIRALLERLAPRDLAAIDQGIRALHTAAIALRTEQGAPADAPPAPRKDRS